MENEVTRLRKALGLTQEELGSRTNVSRVTVARWESGTRSPSPRHLAKLRELAANPTSVERAAVAEEPRPDLVVYTVEEAASLFNVSVKTVYNNCRNGQIRAGRSNGCWRVTEAAMIDFLKNTYGRNQWQKMMGDPGQPLRRPKGWGNRFTRRQRPAPPVED